MEIIEKYIKFVKKWEGGLSRNPSDSCSAMPCPTAYNGKTGWHTNAGICYSTWVGFYGKTKDADFYRMPSDMWFQVFKKGYWDKVKGDAFNSQNIAAFVTGMAWGSGPKQAGISLQRVLNLLGKKVAIDGVIGNQTILAANSVPPRELFDALANERERFFYVIGVGKNAKFLKGWLNRLEDYKKTFRP